MLLKIIKTFEMLNINSLYKFKVIKKKNMNYQRINHSLFERSENLTISKKIIAEKDEENIQNIFSGENAKFLLINNLKIGLDKS